MKYLKSYLAEILAKYYLSLYIYKSNFQKDIYKKLKEDKIDKNINTFYEDLRLISLISDDYIIKIKKYLNNKIKGFPSWIVFTKTFLLFPLMKMKLRVTLNILIKNYLLYNKIRI